MTGIEHYLTLAEPFLRDYGYATVFVGVFLESFGLPVPGESLIMASALLASRGDLHIVPLLGVVWSAAVLGDNVGYAIGLFGGRRLILRYGTRVGMAEPRLAKVEDFFRRYGAEVVVIARFFVILRQLNGVTAGTVAMSWLRFLLYNALGATLWVAVWGLGLFYLGRNIDVWLGWVRQFGYVGLVSVGIIVVTLLLIRFIRKRRQF